LMLGTRENHYARDAHVPAGRRRLGGTVLSRRTLAPGFGGSRSMSRSELLRERTWLLKQARDGRRRLDDGSRSRPPGRAGCGPRLEGGGGFRGSPERRGSARLSAQTHPPRRGEGGGAGCCYCCRYCYGYCTAARARGDRCEREATAGTTETTGDGCVRGSSSLVHVLMPSLGRERCNFDLEESLSDTSAE
jgi:hypothetical protein